VPFGFSSPLRHGVLSYDTDFGLDFGLFGNNIAFIEQDILALLSGISDPLKSQ